MPKPLLKSAHPKYVKCVYAKFPPEMTVGKIYKLDEAGYFRFNDGSRSASEWNKYMSGILKFKIHTPKKRKTTLKTTDNMRNVIFIDKPKKQEQKPIELTAAQGSMGWEQCSKPDPSVVTKIVYLGKCGCDGDMFAVYFKIRTISIYKGYLNSGKY